MAADSVDVDLERLLRSCEAREVTDPGGLGGRKLCEIIKAINVSNEKSTEYRCPVFTNSSI